MSSENRPVGEADLHAYVDDRLGAGDRERVEAWLRSHPEERARIADYRRLNRDLHALYDGVLEEPVPAALRRRPGDASGRATAHALRRWLPGLALAAGLFLGWFARELVVGPDQLVDWLVRDAVIAHEVYSPAMHPFDVAADDPQRLAVWAAERVGGPIAVPRLDSFGYTIAGARLLPGYEGPAIQLIYTDPAGRRLTLIVVRTAADTPEVEVRQLDRGGLTAQYWVDDGLGCALVAEAGVEIEAAAESAYRQLTGS